MTLHHSPKMDAVIVGGRCAGAATAMLLARAGLRVLVIERDDYGTDALSTHALMRTGAALLGRWGILDRIAAAGTPLVRKTTFDYDGERIEIDIRPDPDTPGLFAPRRTVLDRHLVDAAIAAGAEVRFGTRATELMRDSSGRVNGVVMTDRNGRHTSVRADLVIGADGRHSMVASQTDARRIASAPATTAGVFGYIPGLPNDGYLWFFAEGAHLSVIPTNGGEHCVCAIVHRDRYREVFGASPEAGFLNLVRRFDPAMADTVSAQMQDVRLRRWGGAEGFMRRCQGRGWALVGDAGYFKDPLTAHGITDAFRDASLLAQTYISRGRSGLVEYERTRNRLSYDLFDVTRDIAGFQWSLDELKGLHAELNATMKAEHIFMEHFHAPLKVPAE